MFFIDPIQPKETGSRQHVCITKDAGEMCYIDIPSTKSKNQWFKGFDEWFGPKSRDMNV